MISSSRQINRSFHAELYNLIPEKHPLRKINEDMDFSFVHDVVQDFYSLNYGRPTNEPELLFRILFLQYLYNLSDEWVIEDAQVNLAYRRFLNLNPEDALPDPSQLSRFHNHPLGASRVERLLEEVVRQCVDKQLIKSDTLLVDATHTQANAAKEKPLDVLRNAAKRLHRWSLWDAHSSIPNRICGECKKNDKTQMERSLSHKQASCVFSLLSFVF
jgi:transposase